VNAIRRELFDEVFERVSLWTIAVDLEIPLRRLRRNTREGSDQEFGSFFRRQARQCNYVPTSILESVFQSWGRDQRIWNGPRVCAFGGKPICDRRIRGNNRSGVAIELLSRALPLAQRKPPRVGLFRCNYRHACFSHCRKHTHVCPVDKAHYDVWSRRQNPTTKHRDRREIANQLRATRGVEQT